jgi:ribonuclease HI
VEPPKAFSAILYCDGCCKKNKLSGAGIVIKDQNLEILVKDSKFLGYCTSNEAEYGALIFGLKRALAMGITDLLVRSDSLLVVNQILGKYQIRNPNLVAYWAEAKDLIFKFKSFQIQHVKRIYNKEADRMANVAVSKNRDRISTLSDLLERLRIEFAKIAKELTVDQRALLEEIDLTLKD